MKLDLLSLLLQSRKGNVTWRSWLLSSKERQAVWNQGMSPSSSTADQGTSQLFSIPCFTLINCSYHRSSSFTAWFLLGLSHSHASYKWELHIFTFSVPQKSVPLTSMISVCTVFGSCDYQFCGTGSCCSFTSMVSPDTCKLKWSRVLSLAAYFHML